MPGPHHTRLNSITSAARRTVLRWRRPVAVILYLGMAWAANATAFLVRFDGQVPASEWAAHLAALPWLLAARTGGFIAFGRFRGLWRYPSLYDLRDIVLAVLISSLGFFVLVRWVFDQTGYPRSIYIIDALVLIALLSTFRLTRRAYDELLRRPGSKRILVIGGGNAGEMIVRDMRHNPDYDYHPVGIIDDAPGKQGERIQGVPVLGTRADMARIVEKTHPDDVLIAMPSAAPATIRQIVHDLQPFHLRIRTLPSLREIVDGTVTVSQIRNLAIEDLLARPPIGLDPEPLRRLIGGRRVMVTGAGGSIGSELCRQIATLGPASLLLLERYENSLFAIANELQDQSPAFAVRPLVADVGDRPRLDAVFAEHKPQVVFHAAAHKHVPLMELSPCEAVKNNVLGTQQIVEVASANAVERFILISTDKAVNPTSMMGVSKRVAELIVQSMNGTSGTIFAAVRFGNVLGSNGSVVPRFLEQIRTGGPVTVTDPEMRRFFMLIPEAVQLVMHAGAMATGGEIFVLDMGEQIKVLDMARTLIRLSGYVPDEDIKITFTGLRPGEKLSEELVGVQETVEPSGTPKINRLQRNHPVDPKRLGPLIDALADAARASRISEMQQLLHGLVPTYRPGGLSERDSSSVG